MYMKNIETMIYNTIQFNWNKNMIADNIFCVYSLFLYEFLLRALCEL